MNSEFFVPLDADKDTLTQLCFLPSCLPKARWHRWLRTWGAAPCFACSVCQLQWPAMTSWSLWRPLTKSWSTWRLSVTPRPTSTWCWLSLLPRWVLSLPLVLLLFFKSTCGVLTVTPLRVGLHHTTFFSHIRFDCFGFCWCSCFYILLKADADSFYTTCNGRQFNSIEDAVCQLVYVERAEVIKSEEVQIWQETPVCFHCGSPSPPRCLHAVW